MKSLLKKVKDNLLVIYVIINILYMLVGSILYTRKIIKFNIFSYGYIVLLCINVLVILILFFKKKYKKKIIDIFLLLIIIFAVISTIYAYKPSKALYGEWMRYEGLFTILYYITLAFISSFIKKEDKKKIVYFIIAFGVIQTLYAICQRFYLFKIPTTIYKGERWAKGLTINPNFLGSLILMSLSYSIGLFIDSKQRIKQIIYLIISSLLFFGLLLTNALSSVVGLIIVMIILLIYSIKNRLIIKYIILSIILIFILIITSSNNCTTIVDDVLKTKTEAGNIIKGDIDDDYGTGRIEVWRKTMDIVPNYLLHGVGIDNFAHVIDGKSIVRGVRHPIRYDKAHNEYLQILVTMGIFSLISYLCLHFFVIKEGIKGKEIYLLLPVIGYLVQAQFNISVIEVAPLFYIGMGLLVNRYKTE